MKSYLKEGLEKLLSITDGVNQMHLELKETIPTEDDPIQQTLNRLSKGMDQTESLSEKLELQIDMSDYASY